MTGSPVAVLSGRQARNDSAVRLGAMAVLWLSLLLVTFWWVVDGGVQELGGWATGLTSLGRLTGLAAAVLLLAQVVLMARVPLLEAAFGQDYLARIHRVTGFTSFNLMLAHLVTITWGYAAGELRKTPATLWDLTVNYPGMLLAVGGTIGLCLSVLTSIRAARRRIRYESWHLLHLYAYLGVGLALPHQLWTGQEFLSSTGRTVFWWTAWAVAAATVLVYRIGLPVWRNARHRLRVTAVVPESDQIVSVYVAGRRLESLRAEAGQFFSWRFLGRPGWTRANPYSLSAAPDGRGLRITVQYAGDGSAALGSVRPGTRVLVEGPFGRMSPRARTRHKIALIGAGVGVTPLRALAEGLSYEPGDAVLVQRYADKPLFHDEFQALWRDRGLSLLTLPGPRRSPDSWFGAGVGELDDLHALLHWIPDIADRDVYLCGPGAWTQLVRATLTAAGLPTERLHLESFKW
ncbi:ferric reductase-like transmembrane domain-containing protein [Kribbella sp. NPDC004875]|uniref:ferredoxin reductase family protein n=1 Tax=Kribbella sp. NPDC004875 TaxID=3364107 RepID=UPI0036C4D798